MDLSIPLFGHPHILLIQPELAGGGEMSHILYNVHSCISDWLKKTCYYYIGNSF